MSIPRLTATRLRRTFPSRGTLDRESVNLLPSIVDILCRNSSGGTLSGVASAGCDVVTLDLANLVEGRPLPVKKTPATVGVTAFGVVVDDQGTVANGDPVWVRIWGIHDFVQIDGTAAIANGDYLATFGSAGVLRSWAAGNQIIAQALEAYSTGVVAAKKAFILNPSRIYGA